MGVYLGIILFINFILNIIIYLIFLLLLIFYFIINYFIIPQIAMVKFFFPSKRGEGDEPLLRIKRGTRVPLQVVPLLDAIIVYYGWTIITNFGKVNMVLLLDAITIIISYKGGRRVTVNFGGVGVVSLLGTIIGCHSSVL